MAAQFEVILWATPIFVADVTLANIASEDDDFLRLVENACLAITHGTTYSNCRDAACLFPPTDALSFPTGQLLRAVASKVACG